MRRLLYIVPALVFALIAAYLLAGLGLDPKTLPSAMIDKPAPAFDLPALADGAGPEDGRPGRGGGPGQRLRLLVRALPGRAPDPHAPGGREGVPIYGINQKDKPDDARRFLAQLGNPYRRIGVDADGRASIEWGVYGVPETFVIDRAGRIRYRHVGAFGPQDLDPILAMIERLRRG